MLYNAQHIGSMQFVDAHKASIPIANSIKKIVLFTFMLFFNVTFSYSPNKPAASEDVAVSQGWRGVVRGVGTSITLSWLQ